MVRDGYSEFLWTPVVLLKFQLNKRNIIVESALLAQKLQIKLKHIM